MSASKNQLIRSTFAIAASEPQMFADDLKSHLFARDASLRRLFPATAGTRDADIVGTLRAVVDGLDDAAGLAALAERIASVLLAARIQPRQYGCIGQALMDTLAARLGAAFTEDARDAWCDAYVRVAEAVMAARYNPMELVA